jgi:hypothetical protein
MLECTPYCYNLEGARKVVYTGFNVTECTEFIVYLSDDLDGHESKQFAKIC